MGLTEPKLFLLLIIVLVIFGPKNLPKLAQAIGRSVRELKNGMAGITDDVRDSMNAPAQAVKTELSTPAAPVSAPAPTIAKPEGAVVETTTPSTPKSV